MLLIAHWLRALVALRPEFDFQHPRGTSLVSVTPGSGTGHTLSALRTHRQSMNAHKIKITQIIKTGIDVKNFAQLRLIRIVLIL